MLGCANKGEKAWPGGRVSGAKGGAAGQERAAIQLMIGPDLNGAVIRLLRRSGGMQSHSVGLWGCGGVGVQARPGSD